MESDGQLPLHDLVAARLKDAHTRVWRMRVPEDARKALTRRLLVITAAAKHDLSGAARRLDRFVAELDGEGTPGRREGPGTEGSA
ncbi:hypothetical protein F0L17_19000 [Streptomyces sp. TRM43335]|uniref:Uncharacterized protein n=1 Tax=Streptomyces taklimakanensis TaxID=2569853 RepID=A0A6G2BFV4_9ACTN|nr:hypothetical protein [Streptomyces taklimakanensis]MTE21167.1 hypothetical protein [Streptomyces taklimakanensis]